MDDISIAIGILTKNEQENIGRCIKHHQQYGDVFLFDSGSTDDTLRIAKSLGTPVLSRDWTGFADQRNFAIELLKNDYEWLVFIDADEIFDSGVFNFIKTNIKEF